MGCGPHDLGANEEVLLDLGNMAINSSHHVGADEGSYTCCVGRCGGLALCLRMKWDATTSTPPTETTSPLPKKLK